MPQLTPLEALQLTSTFVSTAERMRTSGTDLEKRALLYDTASRVAFLRAHLLSQRDEVRPMFGEIQRRAIFSIA